MKRPTNRQVEILEFIAESIATRGYAPTYREMMAHFGWVGTNSAADHLRYLEIKGLLKVDRQKSRAIVLTEEGLSFTSNRTREKLPAKTTSLPPTGYVDPPSMRCERCSRVFFGRSHERHVCIAEDLKVAS